MKTIILTFTLLIIASALHFSRKSPEIARLCLIKKEEIEILASYRTNVDSYVMYTSSKETYIGENGDVIKECTIKENSSNCSIVKENDNGNYDYINPICIR